MTRTDEDGNGEKRSFWKTPSGLAALGTLITAIVGAVSVLASLTGDGGSTSLILTPTQTQTPTPTPTVSISETPTPPQPQDKLLDHIPSLIAGSCSALDSSSAGALAAVSCRGPQFPGDGTIRYYLFDTRVAMYAYFTPRSEQVKAPPGAQCDDAPLALSTYKASDGTDPGGYLLCYKKDDRRYLEWTRDSFLIYAWIESTASRRNIYKFWTEAGPIAVEEASASPSPLPT